MIHKAREDFERFKFEFWNEIYQSSMVKDARDVKICNKTRVSIFVSIAHAYKAYVFRVINNILQIEIL